ncbi:hypothetical protein J6I39_06625 [bacterium]|nr:hypothetical protein [bacterium]
MQTIKIQCPAKINLNLKVTGKLEGGYHSIESIMQTIDLFDYITINVENSDKTEIILSGNSSEIPYDEHNLAYKAAKLYIDNFKIENKKIDIYIEKNIPIAAGLAGGSTDAAGVLYGLNKIFRNSESFGIKSSDKTTIRRYFANAQYDNTYLDTLCSQLGSDLNVCLHGGRILAQGRGEITTPLEFEEFNVSLIKPLNLGVSAKEAYTKFSRKNNIPPTALCATSPLQGAESRMNFVNDLEWAIIDDYPQLQYIKQKYPKSVMTGSGSTYFVIEGEFEQEKGYWIKNGLKSIDFGVKEV